MAGRHEGSLSSDISPVHRELTLRLRELRARAGVTYAELSHRTGYSASSLSRILSGVRVPKIELLEGLFEALDVESEDQTLLSDLCFRAQAEALQPEAAATDDEETGNVWLQRSLQELRTAAGQPSIRHIAELASGLSATTVHRVLRAQDQHHEHVLGVARALTQLLPPEADRHRALTNVNAALYRVRPRPGLPLSEVSDPFHLEVHYSIDSIFAGLPMLPAYVDREHDRELVKVVERAAAGVSQIAVLVGEAGTGKTRACWEALKLLRERDEPWRLWHPLDPSRPDAALAELDDVAPYTVVWLNEAQLYLGPDTRGEQLGEGLRNLLRDPGRAPVLVLATLWPHYWHALTARTEQDPHPNARELLDGHSIQVPDTFSGPDLATLTDKADLDPRLSKAADYAHDGRITQYLAGVPVLMDRYHEAPVATRALIHAAMDARRLGAGPRLPLAWLADAAPGYLTDDEWAQTGGGWLQYALEYVTTPCNGISGILTPVKMDAPRNRRDRLAIVAPLAGRHGSAGQGPLYQLADYLDQHGRRHRADQIPPIDFWTAAAAHAHPADLTALGNAAWARGLYRDGAQLHKLATTHGNACAAAKLVDHFHTLHPADHRPARWAAAHVALDDPAAVARLLDSLRQAGAEQEAAVLLGRGPAAHVALDDPAAVARLLDSLRQAGAEQEAAVLLGRGPAAHVALDDPAAVARLLDSLRQAGAEEQATGVGLFDQFIEINDHREQFRFGREPDGSAASLWMWEDLV
ncbi:helix-turn-helix transcriptional regulator [Streptomyces sp. RLB3-5]|uniref:helix-turn-helix domain-containing protein n=1 Tax=unclassified Streptomyces TaxID=2593676 RepID=UPI001162DBD1|nr:MULTISPECIES: helix-turn-helix transcriptional regulator [unclassified Streptomyces]QDO51710.1 helix-turn-helix transcriptional regulator [Streptomyces sp. RLB3-5]QDO61952.1 helix-turn-helix transcriptional regulator [Streptomyces sp. RLB1-8]